MKHINNGTGFTDVSERYATSIYGQPIAITGYVTSINQIEVIWVTSASLLLSYYDNSRINEFITTTYEAWKQ